MCIDIIGVYNMYCIDMIRICNIMSQIWCILYRHDMYMLYRHNMCVYIYYIDIIL